MAIDPNNQSSPQIDDSGRSIPLGQMGIHSLDNPVYSRGVGPPEPDGTPVSPNIFQRVYFFPESLGNVDANSFTENYDTPRHVTKISILDYYGGDLSTTDKFQKVQDSIELLGVNARPNGSTIGETVDNFSNALEPAEISRLGNAIASAGLDLTTNKARSIQNRADEIVSQTAINPNLVPDEIQAIIYLYANGENLKFNYGTNWSELDLGIGTKAMLNAANSALKGNETDATKDAVVGGLSALFNRLKSSTGLGAEIDTVTGIIGTKIGRSPAQNYEYLFEGVARRSFGVSCTMYPKSEREAKSAAQIVSAFKYYSHPSRTTGNDYFVKIPSLFLVENLTYDDASGWVPNLYLPRHKVCALTNMDVNMSQDGAIVTHEKMLSVGGVFKSPIKIQLNLNFQEVNVLTREDITDPQDFFDPNTKRGY